jgi:hypothetical protein
MCQASHLQGEVAVRGVVVPTGRGGSTAISGGGR